MHHTAGDDNHTLIFISLCSRQKQLQRNYLSTELKLPETETASFTTGWRLAEFEADFIPRETTRLSSLKTPTRLHTAELFIQLVCRVKVCSQLQTIKLNVDIQRTQTILHVTGLTFNARAF